MDLPLDFIAEQELHLLSNLECQHLKLIRLKIFKSNSLFNRLEAKTIDKWQVDILLK